MFALLQAQLQQRGLVFNPTAVMSDFEQAIIQATELSLPTTTHRGCFFHFGQAILRKVQKVSLQEEY